MEIRGTRRRVMLQPENIALGLVICCIVGIVIHGDTPIKIPRYYPVETTNSDGTKEWVFLKEENTFGGGAKGEANALWEPPCVAEEETTAEFQQPDGKKIDQLDGTDVYFPIFEMEKEDKNEGISLDVPAQYEPFLVSELLTPSPMEITTSKEESVENDLEGQT